MGSGTGEITQLEQIGAIEKRLWAGADTLRANSNFASNEYFLPVMGLIFLRHAYSRFLAVSQSKVDGETVTSTSTTVAVAVAVLLGSAWLVATHFTLQISSM